VAYFWPFLHFSFVVVQSVINYRDLVGAKCFETAELSNPLHSTTLADLLTDDAVVLALVSCFGSSGVGGGGLCKSEHQVRNVGGVFHGVALFQRLYPIVFKLTIGYSRPLSSAFKLAGFKIFGER